MKTQTDKITSVRMNKELWKAVKVYCVKNNIPINKFLDDLIRDKLEMYY